MQVFVYIHAQCMFAILVEAVSPIKRKTLCAQSFNFADIPRLSKVDIPPRFELSNSELCKTGMKIKTVHCLLFPQLQNSLFFPWEQHSSPYAELIW